MAQLSIKLLHHFPDAHILNLGGGFKIARVPGENAFSFETFSPLIEEIFTKFAQETGRKIQLEIEPGHFLVGNSGALLMRIQDITETYKHHFLKVDAGMTEVIRPAMYGSRHPFELHSKNPSEKEEFVHIVGHCCESSDVLTADETIALPHTEIGDLLVMGGTGAYCAGMNTTHYNSFPQCPEVVIQKDGSFKEIRRRETIEEMLTLEV